MQAMIDAAGRLLLSEEILQQSGLKPGMTLEVCWRGGRIELEPAPVPVQLLRQGRWLVAVPQQDVGPLQTETVEQTREALMHERSA